MGRRTITTPSAEASATRQPTASGTSRSFISSRQWAVAAVDLAQVFVFGNLAVELGILLVHVGVVLPRRRELLGVQQHLFGVDEVAPVEVGQFVLGAEPDSVHRARFF